MSDPQYKQARMETPEELARCRKPCKCGYSPLETFYSPHARGIDEAKAKKCSCELALRNHITFPSFELMVKNEGMLVERNPDKILTRLSKLYYASKAKKDNFEPLRHWATLVQITEDLTSKENDIICCSVYNQFGERFDVHFFPHKGEEPETFKWSQMKPGSTMAILYPEKKPFLNLRWGIKQNDLDTVFIFDTSLKKVQDEAERLLQSADLGPNSKETSECFSCGIKADLSRCASCKLAKYCSKECQTKAWKSGHKKLCKQADVLLRLALLPRHKFETHFSFNQGTDEFSDYLPAYTPYTD